MSRSSAKAQHPVFGKNPVPRYLQLADIFRQRIKRGLWKSGEMIPSIEMLIDEFSVARITVRQAIRLLKEEGLLSPQRGRGTVVNTHDSAQRLLKVETTFSGLVDIYRRDKPVTTNLEESNASPALLESDGIPADSYFHMRRVHARDGVKYCVISIYIDEEVFRTAEHEFRNEAVLPVLYSLPDVKIENARQTMHISKADLETANLLEIPLGEPMAEVRRILSTGDKKVIYLADVSYQGSYIHLDMDLKP